MNPKKLTTILLVIFSITLANSALAMPQSQKIYFLDLEYDKGALKLLDVNLITGFPDVQTDKSLISDPTNICKVELLSIAKELVYEGYFLLPIKLYPTLGEPTTLDKVDFAISLPYFKSGQAIKITKDSQELLTVDVSKFQMYCGDGKCQSDENYQACPRDCAEEKEGPPKPPTGGEGKPFSYIPYLIGIIVAIVVLIFLLIKFKKKPKSGESI